MTRIYSSGLLCAGLVVFSACGSAGQETPPAKVKIPPISEFKPKGKRYKRQYARYAGFDLPPEKVAEIKAGFDKDPRQYLGIVDPAKKYYEYYWITDDWRLQEGKWFNKWASEHWLPKGDIGKFREMSRGGGVNDVLKSGFKEYSASCRYRGPKTDFYATVVYLPAGFPYEVSSQLIQSFMSEVRLRNRRPEGFTEGKYRIARCRGRSGYIVRWPVSNRMFVRLSTAGEYPKEVIREWLKRFPSSLPKDWKWEKGRAQWAQSYFEYIMWRMTIKLPRDLGTDATSFQGDASYLTLNFAGFGPYHRPQKDGAYKTPEKVIIWNELVEWGNSARGRLAWDKKLRKFRIDKAKKRLPDKWKKLDPAKVKGESELPYSDPTAGYPEHKEADEKARKSIERALKGGKAKPKG